MKKIHRVIIKSKNTLPLNKWEVSSSLYDVIISENSQFITVLTGAIHTQISLAPSEKEENTIFVSPKYLERCSLPPNDFPISLRELGRNRFDLGPIIMILTDFISHKNKVNFGTLDSFCEEFQEIAAKNNALCYVSDGVEWSSITNRGYVSLSGKWIEQEVPIPHIVYNRIHSRSRERNGNTAALFSSLKDFNIPFFNDRFIDKWEIHECLTSFPHLRPYLPDTKRLETFQDLESYLHDHQTVFIKPIDGAQGRGIFKVIKEEASFTLVSTMEHFKEESFETLEQLFKKIKRKIEKRPYIIQRGLHLLDWEKKAMDFRVLCHQEEAHSWKVTSMIARIADPTQFVSNIAKGGELEKLDHVLLSLFSKKEAHHIKRWIREISIEICQSLYHVLGGLYAEFGLDIAIDTTGRPWLIEVNTKPSKHTGMPVCEKGGIRPSVYAVFHACYHFGFIKE